MVQKHDLFLSGGGVMEFKPCPFCGGAVSIIQIRTPLPDFEDVDKGDYEVFCARCNAAIVFFKAKQNVDELWNRRADK